MKLEHNKSYLFKVYKRTGAEHKYLATISGKPQDVAEILNEYYLAYEFLFLIEDGSGTVYPFDYDDFRKQTIECKVEAEHEEKKGE